MKDNARKEPKTSTPLHLQIIRCSEFEHLDRAVNTIADSMDKMSLKLSDLEDLLTTALQNNVVSAIQERGMLSTFDESQLIDFTEDHESLTDEFTPPQYLYQANKMIQRLLESMRLRQRMCTDGLHYHGLRLYYNPGALDGAPEGLNLVPVGTQIGQAGEDDAWADSSSEISSEGSDESDSEDDYDLHSNSDEE